MLVSDKKICKKYILSPSCREIYLSHGVDMLQNLREKGLAYGGVSFVKDYYSIIRSESECNHLIFTLKGQGKLYVPDGEFDLLPGTLYVGKAGLPHHYTLDGEYWEFAWLIFSPLDNKLNNAIKNSPMIRNSLNGTNVKSLIEKVCEENFQPDRHTPDAMLAIDNLLLITLSREFSLEQSDVDSERAKFNELKNKICQDLRRNWDIQMLIRESRMFYVPVHFNRLCKKHWGMPAMKKVTELRMMEAKKLLQYTDYPIGLISEQVGYSNPYAFSTAFKKYFKASPSKIKAENILHSR